MAADGVWAGVRESMKNNQLFAVERQGRSIRPDGFTGGLYSGYNFRFGDHLVPGVDIDLIWSDADGRFVNTPKDSTTEIRLGQAQAAAMRTRIGIAFDRFLPCLAAGVAYGSINRRLTARYPYNMQVDTDRSDRMGKGWTAGFCL